jgi:menaquinone-specific isochorismate synthase
LAGVEDGRGQQHQYAADRLAVRSVAVADPGDLVARLPGPAALAWIRHGEGMVGWGEAARITLPAGEDMFTAGEKWLRELFDRSAVDDQVQAQGSGPVAFGSFTFDPTTDGSVLAVPAMVLGRRAGQAWLTSIGDPGASLPVPSPLRPPSVVRWHDGSRSAPDWERAVATAVGRIKAGQLGKVVLSRDLYAITSADIDTRVLLARLAARYPGCYTFACAGLVGATPELLISRQDTEVGSVVLAGTIPRGRDAAEDAALGAHLLGSAKDVAEHEYAVAGVRATLAPLCETLSVDPRPSLLRLANVQHLATRVRGRLAGSGTEHSVLALVAALHPTGAVCGTPTETAMELIRELEGMDRGRYAGPVGWMDAQGNGEWCIALRCAEIEGSRARLFAGCGIVAGSDPEAELAEAQTKFRPMQFALEG